MVGKDMAAGDVWVTPDEHHLALYTRAAVLHTPQYVAGSAPDELSQRGQLACTLVPRCALKSQSTLCMCWHS